MFSFHSFNSWATAKRITTYWSFREGIFGERAFLPLDLSGKGAMSLEDVRMLHTGCLMFLPFDLKGRSVLYIDRSKLLEDEKISSRLLFFCIQRIMQNKMSQTSGSVALVNLSTPFGATFQTDNIALAKDLIRKGMPMKAEGEIHVVCTPPLQGRNSFVSSCKSFEWHRALDKATLFLTSLYGSQFFPCVLNVSGLFSPNLCNRILQTLKKTSSIDYNSTIYLEKDCRRALVAPGMALMGGSYLKTPGSKEIRTSMCLCGTLFGLTRKLSAHAKIPEPPKTPEMP